MNTHLYQLTIHGMVAEKQQRYDDDDDDDDYNDDKQHNNDFSFVERGRLA